MKIKALHNHVIVKQHDESEIMYGNIIVPDMGKEKPLMGTAVEVGPGLYNPYSDGIIPMQTKVGNTVLFPSFGGQKVSIKNEEFIIMKDSDILAILEDEESDLPSKLSKEQLDEIFAETKIKSTEARLHKII